MEHRLGIKNGPKIKIDEYFFVEIKNKKEIKLKLQGGVNWKKNSKIRIKIEQKFNLVLK